MKLKKQRIIELDENEVKDIVADYLEDQGYAADRKDIHFEAETVTENGIVRLKKCVAAREYEES